MGTPATDYPQVRPRTSLLRRRTALAFYATVAPCGLAALYFTGPPPSFEHPEWLFAMIAIAVVCEVSSVWLGSGVHLNATIAVAVMALAIAGPIAAFAVLVLPDLVMLPVRRDERILRVGTLTNLAAYAWAALAGGGVLALADAHGTALAGMPALITAGLSLAVTNFVIGPGVYAPLELGVPARAMADKLAGALPAVLAMVLAGVATTALIPAVGLAALAGFALVTLVPSSGLTLLARARPVAALDFDAAARLYAEAIADVLRLPRSDRALLARAGALIAQSPDPHLRLLQSLPARGRTRAHVEIAEIAAHADERWNGTGLPAGVMGALSPSLSRVLAVAHGWARLTAHGTAELSHVEALLDLEADSGSAYDPAVVAAAGVVVERDTRLAREPAARPRIHAWPGSWAFRGWLAPRLLALAHAER
jgi:hypothetical protein